MTIRSLMLVTAIALLGCVAAAQEPHTDTSKKFYKLTGSVQAAYQKGDKKLAAAQANELLAMAPGLRQDWNYGNAIHTGQLILGRIAADSGDLKEAKRRLLASVAESSMPFGYELQKNQPWEPQDYRPKWKASPQMDTFGPDMTLASLLLEKGERETVLKYLDDCAKFWTMGGDHLALWRSQINAGERPNFGPNMIYFFPRDPERTQ